MRHLLATAALGLGLAALPGPVHAQQPTPASPPGLTQPPAPAATGRRQPRPDTVPADPGAAQASASRDAANKEAAAAARKAADRDKAWDKRMKRTLGSICSGC